MTEPFRRHDIIELLKTLGSDNEQEVLDAARQVHMQITNAGISWEDLLQSTDPVSMADTNSAPLPDSATPTSELDDKPGYQPDHNFAESLKLIEKLLARPSISDDFREELEGYKFDISEGEFDEVDDRYLRSLYKRLLPNQPD